MADAGIKIGMKPPHPGDFIRTEVIEELGLTITHAAEILGVSQVTLTELLDSKIPQSPEMALRMEKAFGIGMAMMLKMQAWYDTVQMRDRSNEIEVERYQPVR